MEQSRIKGVMFTPIAQIQDSRGAVLHILREDAPDFSRFGECYVSEIFPGQVKAWKMHTEQSQNIAVPFGRIRIVFYDDRMDSYTRGEVQAIEVGRPDQYIRVHIEPGIWYGFACISDLPAYLVNCVDRIHNPSESRITPIDDNRIPYRWN